MQFKDIIGQEEIKSKLIRSVQENRVPHAQMFVGPPGNGKLALALAYAQYIQCQNRSATDSCGVCPACQKMSKYIHPDLHFVMPTSTTKKVKKDNESDLFLEEWREYLQKCEGYANESDWYSFLEIENKQGYISVRDAKTLIHKLNFKAFEGSYKIIILWMAEELRTDTANKLLKILEEPPAKTVFLLVAEEPEQILATIKSRTVMHKTPRIGIDELQNALMERFDTAPEKAHDIALISDGSWITARYLAQDNNDYKYNFMTFQQWMRLCFKSKIAELIDLSNNIKDIGRERQKQFLTYCLAMVHNTLLVNNGLSDRVQLPDDEKNFCINFAPFINNENVTAITSLLSESIDQIEQNAYAPLLFTNLSFKLCTLLRAKAK